MIIDYGTISFTGYNKGFAQPDIQKAVKNTCLTTKATTGLHQEREPCLTAITFHKTVFFQKNTRTPLRTPQK